MLFKFLFVMTIVSLESGIWNPLNSSKFKYQKPYNTSSIFSHNKSEDSPTLFVYICLYYCIMTSTVETNHRSRLHSCNQTNDHKY